MAEAMRSDYGAATGETVHDEDRYEAAEAIDQVDLSHLDDVPDLRDELRGVLHANRLAFLRDGRLPEAAAIPPVSIRVQQKEYCSLVPLLLSMEPPEIPWPPLTIKLI